LNTDEDQDDSIQIISTHMCSFENLEVLFATKSCWYFGRIEKRRELHWNTTASGTATVFGNKIFLFAGNNRGALIKN